MSRRFFGLILTTTVFLFFLWVFAFVIIELRGGEVAYLQVFSGKGFWKMVAISLFSFASLAAMTDNIFLRISGQFKVSAKMRYGLSFLFFTVTVSLLFFVPIALFKVDFWVVGVVVILTAVSGFLAGYIRGFLVDNGFDGSTSRTV